MKRTKVICVGEALIDRIKNKFDSEFTDFLGGAPANVACALKKLKVDSVFIGCLGNDKLGKKFIEKFNELEVNTDFVQVVKKYPTRIVKVNRDNLGDRYFSGFDANPFTVFADEVLNSNLFEKDIKRLEKIFLETKYIITGTNILTSSISAESIHYLLRKANKFDTKVVIDLNWREVFWDFSTISSNISKKEKVNNIKNFLNYCDVLKMAKEEAILFFENDNPCEISRKILNQPDVIITDGGNQISWFVDGFNGTTEVNNFSKIVDTTGAGDAFLAGLISKLISCDFQLNEFEINKFISYASVCGYLTCLGEGAIDQQPDYQKVHQYFGSEIS